MATIKFKRGSSDTTGTLAAGEPALNTASSKLWIGVDGTNKKWVGAEIEASPSDWTDVTKLATQSAINTTFMPKSGGTFTGSINGTSLTLSGDLTVNGTTTNINSTNLVIEDKNIILGDVTTPSDTTADGGGITLKGLSDKTFNWVDSTDAWTSSEHMNLASGKAYYINGTSVLSSTTLGSGVTGSSLTSLGTIGTGVWQGTSVAAGYGGTGQSTYTVGDILYASGSTTLSKLSSSATAGSVLASTGATSAPEYKTLSLTNGSVTSGSGTLTLAIQNAAADGSTKGLAAFNSTSFSASSGVIDINTVDGGTF